VNPKGDRVDLNSQIRFAESIYTALIHDVASGRPPQLRSSLLRDLDTILNRIRKEGMGFCTIALPSLGKAVVQSFKTGYLSVPTAFAVKKGTSLPKLFQGLMEEIYTGEGKLREDFCIASVTEVRQLCELAYKLDLPYSKETEGTVISNFLEVERSLRTLDLSGSEEYLELASTIVATIFEGFDPKKIVPQHGPGNVASREKGMAKWIFGILFQNIHQFYPYYEFYVVSGKSLHDRKSWYMGLERREHGCARVTLVPKDSRGPRLISLEPLEYQYIQQGLWKAIHRHLRSHPFTSGHVNFRDQSVNQGLAMIGSMCDSWATLDMKDASDRVSLQLVERVFRHCPDLLRALKATRSVGTELPDGTCVPLWKFAPMGSALCFPIESVVHYALCVASIMRRADLSMWEAKDAVYVYGDDLIVAPAYAPGVMEDIESVGLLFNRSKCFLSGPFRESCGYDALLGHNISPIRWRKPWPSNQRDAASLVAFSEFARLLYSRAYVRAADLIWDQMERMVGKLPTCPIGWNVGYLCRRTRSQYFQTPYKVRFCRQLQRWEHRCKTIKQQQLPVECDGWARLLKFALLKAGDDVSLLKPERQSEYSRIVHGPDRCPDPLDVWEQTREPHAGASMEYSDRSSLKDRWMGIF
jgi:hypothetical protein